MVFIMNNFGSKDDVIECYQKEIDRVNHNFQVCSLKYENDDYHLCERIHENLKVLSNFFKQKIGEFEQILEEDYNQLKRKTIEKFDSAHGQIMSYHTNWKKEKLLKHLSDLNAFRHQTKEQLRQAKLGPIIDKEILQRKLPSIRMAITLNADKMKYDLKLLNSTKIENFCIKNFKKQKLLQMNKKIFHLRGEINRLKSKSAQDISKLNNGISKLRSSNTFYKNSNQQINKKLFEGVRTLHERESSELLGKLIKTERFIYENILGMQRINELEVLADNTESELSVSESFPDIESSSNDVAAIIDDVEQEQSGKEIHEEAGCCSEKCLNPINQQYLCDKRIGVLRDNVLCTLGLDADLSLTDLEKDFIIYERALKEEWNEDFQTEKENQTLEDHFASCENANQHNQTHQSAITEETGDNELLSQNQMPRSSEFQDKQNQQLWNLLLCGMNRLLNELNKRKRIKRERDLLRKKNSDLKHFLMRINE